MQLSKRMEMLASLITPGNRLADIGTDHGYIPIYLVEQGQIPSALAMDVRKGPLQRAAAHIEQSKLTQYIETRLSDGLWKLEIGEVDTILIAGMGGPLMERILRERMEIARSVKELVLQPQSEIGEFRGFLAEEGFEIVKEEMVFEEGKYYPMMVVRPGKPYALSKLDQEFGPLLIEETHPVLREFLDWEERQCKKLLGKLLLVENNRTKERVSQVEHRLSLIEQVRILWEENSRKAME